MCKILIMPVLWMFHDCQYARVLNFEGYTGFTYFHKYDKVLNKCRNAIIKELNIPGFQISQIFHMQALLKVLNIPEYGWIMPEWTSVTMAEFCICLVKVWQGFEYNCGSQYPRIGNITRFWICEGNTGCWYAWLSLYIS